jgi:hypothetical protein
VVSAVDVPSATYAKSSGIGAAMMRAHAQFKSGVTPTDASLAIGPNTTAQDGAEAPQRNRFLEKIGGAGGPGMQRSLNL